MYDEDEDEDDKFRDDANDDDDDDDDDDDGDADGDGNDDDDGDADDVGDDDGDDNGDDDGDDDDDNDDGRDHHQLPCAEGRPLRGRPSAASSLLAHEHPVATAFAKNVISQIDFPNTISIIKTLLLLLPTGFCGPGWLRDLRAPPLPPPAPPAEGGSLSPE